MHRFIPLNGVCTEQRRSRGLFLSDLKTSLGTEGSSVSYPISKPIFQLESWMTCPNLKRPFSLFSCAGGLFFNFSSREKLESCSTARKHGEKYRRDFLRLSNRHETRKHCRRSSLSSRDDDHTFFFDYTHPVWKHGMSLAAGSSRAALRAASWGGSCGSR